jgi:hypothetical protein
MYNKKSTHLGSIFCCFALKDIEIISPLVVTRCEFEESVCFIEPAIQMVLIYLLAFMLVLISHQASFV